MKKHRALTIVLIIIVIIGFILVSSYNGFVKGDEMVNNAWSQVETNYQRRADLIPNLVETVKGYAGHESEVFENIAKLRSGYQSAQTPEELSALDSKLVSGINIAVEAYPELKANQNFLALQDELAGSENRIAVARRDYNMVAAQFNIKVRSFPGNIMAKIFGFEARTLFQAAEGAEKAPQVNFGK